MLCLILNYIEEKGTEGRAKRLLPGCDWQSTRCNLTHSVSANCIIWCMPALTKDTLDWKVYAKLIGAGAATIALGGAGMQSE